MKTDYFNHINVQCLVLVCCTTVGSNCFIHGKLKSINILKQSLCIWERQDEEREKISSTEDYTYRYGKWNCPRKRKRFRRTCDSRKVVAKARGEGGETKIFRARRISQESSPSRLVSVRSTIRLIMLSAHLSTQPFIIPPPVYTNIYRFPFLYVRKTRARAADDPITGPWLGSRARTFVYEDWKV